jgi:protein-S-isoprenylcysteine O-methyltransferase
MLVFLLITPSVLRHPAYFGWFYWSIGTQLLLCNPICIIAYTGASWSFFNARIPHEENLLLKFYPAGYPEYLRRTYIGIPFITSKAPAKEKKEE